MSLCCSVVIITGGMPMRESTRRLCALGLQEREVCTRLQHGGIVNVVVQGESIDAGTVVDENVVDEDCHSAGFVGLQPPVDVDLLV